MKRTALPVVALLALGACDPASSGTVNPDVTPNATARLELEEEP